MRRCRQRCMGRWPNKANSEKMNHRTAASPLPSVTTAKFHGYGREFHEVVWLVQDDGKGKQLRFRGQSGHATSYKNSWVMMVRVQIQQYKAQAMCLKRTDKREKNEYIVDCPAGSVLKYCKEYGSGGRGSEKQW
ncbi:hypothetical protein BT96DRAFT_643995 [Gymnopus androsaceus JB14]|uniref:Uncharacterized protein n=1 Tax=Gymnopus androsaceus JB14 TaxID=1447944 RepID=A0A6A4GGH5_9AGAR|nr:hypothetical protein BT96DRAFT_643995 [Gymnopus androsaceus JB14]